MNHRFFGRLKTRLFAKMIAVIAAFIFFCFGSTAQALVVLQYHHVSTESPASTSVSPARFKEHMAWLKENDYKVVSMTTLVDWLNKGETLPNKTVAITFDDAFASIYQNAWPILKQYEYPFTVFTIAEHHDKKSRQYMTWDQLKEMAKSGVVMGNHTTRHEHMLRYLKDENDGQWLARVTRDITDAQTRLDQELGPQIKVFAYPYGEYNSALQNTLKQLGYIAFGQQGGALASFQSKTALPRFPFGGTYGDKKDFASKASAQPLPVSEVVLVDEKGAVLPDSLLPMNVQKPGLRLTGENAALKKIQCFLSGKPINMVLKENQLFAFAVQQVSVGRSRFNCTSPSPNGFQWHSEQIIKKNADGSWYEED